MTRLKFASEFVLLYYAAVLITETGQMKSQSAGHAFADNNKTNKLENYLTPRLSHREGEKKNGSESDVLPPTNEDLLLGGYASVQHVVLRRSTAWHNDTKRCRSADGQYLPVDLFALDTCARCYRYIPDQPSFFVRETKWNLTTITVRTGPHGATYNVTHLISHAENDLVSHVYRYKLRGLIISKLSRHWQYHYLLPAPYIVITTCTVDTSYDLKSSLLLNCLL